MIKDSEFEDFLAGVPDHVWVVVDEAYCEFSTAEEYPDITKIVRKNENIVSVRTFSKAYGMAGLRLGYALADQEVIEAVKRISQPFNANKAALAGAKGVLTNGSHFKEAVSKINDSKIYLISKLKGMGCEVFPSQTNFVFFCTSYSADKISKELLQKGIMVASGSRWGYDKGIRVSVGKPKENRKFLKGLEEILNKKRTR
jgi:histidinol-phosphate aminotransferase